MSSNTIMLGEPVWVDVTVTNRSATALRVDMGSSCFGATPVVIVVAGAQARVDRQVRCGVREGGDCWSHGPYDIAAGATLSKRYLFAGDFHITHDGQYPVRLTKPLRYGPVDASRLGYLPETAPRVLTAVDTTLVVRPADSEKLLALEQGLAAQAMATVPPEQFPPGADIDTVRRIANAHREAEAAAYDVQLSILDGIAAYPAAGMEPIFASWVGHYDGDYEAYRGETALYNLNTPAARVDLADIATSTTGWNAKQAMTYLGFMGDASYVPLLERHAKQNDPQAVFALGYLGGEKAVPQLESLAQHATSDSDRADALMAIGYTGSLRGVPFLLSYLDSASVWNAATFALWLLTHHYVATSRSSTFHDVAAGWRTWWSQNKTTARAYRPWECDEDALIPN